MLYPMTFKPILKKIIWGGSDICPFKGITPVQEGIGESWELSHVEGNYSVVDNGPYIWLATVRGKGGRTIWFHIPFVDQVNRCTR